MIIFASKAALKQTVLKSYFETSYKGMEDLQILSSDDY